MTELAGVAAQIAAPVVTALLEDLHQAAAAEITRLEATMPARIASAETAVQDWATDLLGTLHGLVARIDGARSNVATATTSPASAVTPPASSK